MHEQHVVKKGKKWQVKKSNSKSATKNFPTQQQAIEYGRHIAVKQRCELVIHSADGKIRNKNSYGNDPCPPRDKK